ncbi:hypothetical protein RJT34_01401 [Clitoria ternatea]|uniref:Uncharacterized protein n=1 Tax=Clitoria ternatea TaxID=43366 RepID=A0AAN9Q185_CLITE
MSTCFSVLVSNKFIFSFNNFLVHEAIRFSWHLLSKLYIHLSIFSTHALKSKQASEPSRSHAQPSNELLRQETVNRRRVTHQRRRVSEDVVHEVDRAAAFVAEENVNDL